MFEKIKEKLIFEKSLFIIMILGVLAVFGVVFYLFFAYSSQKISLVNPAEGAELELGKEYEIKWSSRGVDRIGIVLFNGDKPEWIAQNIEANKGNYKWKIPSDHEYGSDFWIGIFDYPWRKGSKIDYSNGPIKITYPELQNCDKLSIENEWPYFASNAPEIRKLFITPESFKGDLGGLEGADKKCRESAIKLGYEGEWTAFLGGDSDEETAIKRIEKTPKGTSGFFVSAKPALELINQTTCHRLIGSNFGEFLAKLTNSKNINNQKLEKEFLGNLSGVWLGRVNASSKKNCISAYFASSYLPVREKYSYSSTCQNWTKGDRVVPGYNEGARLDDSYSSCYTPQGSSTYAVALAGLAEGLIEDQGQERYAWIGKFCSDEQKLICIEN